MKSISWSFTVLSFFFPFFFLILFLLAVTWNDSKSKRKKMSLKHFLKMQCTPFSTHILPPAIFLHFCLEQASPNSQTESPNYKIKGNHGQTILALWSLPPVSPATRLWVYISCSLRGEGRVFLSTLISSI